MQIIDGKDIKPGYCKVVGCSNKPRATLNKAGHKANTRRRVLCRAHAGIRNVIPRKDYVAIRGNKAVQL